MFSRRRLLSGAGFGAVGLAISSHSYGASSSRHPNGLTTALEEIEKKSGGRLGVAVLDTSSGEQYGFRPTERFAMCSTFKWLLAAAVLQRADAGQENLARRVAIPSSGILPNSPMTQEHAGQAITVRELAAAIVTRSDNTAANLLLETIGGPAGLTRFARSIGDDVTRLDRTELSLNEARPGDSRDTTSPLAMVNNLRTLLLGRTLSRSSREQLTAWLVANKTGDERLRAGLPNGWRVGDKTGSNGRDTTNDVAITWAGNRAPFLVAAYLTACPGPEAKRNAVLAGVATAVATCGR